jgi:YbbR domain-containing protein
MKFLRWLGKTLPNVLTALIFSVIIWVTAISEADPTREETLANSTRITVVGLSPDLLLVNSIPERMNLTVRAPSSLITRLNLEPDLVKATLDLSGLEAGTHTLKPQVNIMINPVEVINTSIETIQVELEEISSVSFPVTLNMTGSLPISYQVDETSLESQEVTVIGPRSLVDSISQVVAIVDVSNAVNDIDMQVNLKSINAAGNLVSGVSLSPERIRVSIKITQLGGYRNLFVKIITIGQIANGFYLTGLSASPVNVTVFASEPELVNSMPAFVETVPINLNGASDDFEVEVSLNLPDGIELIGEKTIAVQVGIAPIGSSINFLNIPVQVINLGANFTVTLSPTEVDVYLSGPLYLLESYTFSDIIITLDLLDRGPGTYQLVPVMKMLSEFLKVDAILPGTIEVIIKNK